MARADYIHEIITCAGRNIIKIEDLNLGNKSITNDIENVVAEIARLEKIDPAQYMIVYKDSEGTWDGWDHQQQQFIPLSEEDYRDAVDKYILKQLNAAVKLAGAY